MSRPKTNNQVNLKTGFRIGDKIRHRNGSLEVIIVSLKKDHFIAVDPVSGVRFAFKYSDSDQLVKLSFLKKYEFQ
jgi:hypothetical protein